MAEEDKEIGTTHFFRIRMRVPMQLLDVGEETLIRQGGGPRNMGGPLLNSRVQMRQERYEKAGGLEPFPEPVRPPPTPRIPVREILP